MPVVSVPVLSSATAPQSARASRVRPPRTRAPLCAAAPMAATYASGAMSRAHGAAADRKAKARYMAPPEPAKGMPRTEGPAAAMQKVSSSTHRLYLSDSVSSRRCTRGRRCWAAAVRRAMRAGVLSARRRVALMTSTPSALVAPAGTSSLRRTAMGAASPVRCSSDSSALPCMTTPSRGTCVPARTSSIAPGATSAQATAWAVRRSGPVGVHSTVVAWAGTRAHRARRSPAAVCDRRSSTAWAVANRTSSRAPSRAQPRATVPKTARVVRTWMFRRNWASS